jgi:hypothetical protein
MDRDHQGIGRNGGVIVALMVRDGGVSALPARHANSQAE